MVSRLALLHWRLSASLVSPTRPTSRRPAKPATVRQPENCFARHVWSFLDSTAADCPLTLWGFILYATLDAGLMGPTLTERPGTRRTSTAPMG